MRCSINGTGPLKTAFVTRFPADPAAPHGGVESVSVNLVRALAKFDDLALEVVTTDPNCRELQITKWEGVAVHRLPQTGSRILLDAVGRGRRQMQKYLTQVAPDVIHAHDVYGLMVKGLPIPRVFTIHGFIYGDTLVSGGKFPRLRSRIWRWIETGGWADQHHIISISPYVRERLAGIATGTIHDIDNPISEQFFNIERRPEPGRVLSAAWISPRKNTLGLLKGFAKLVEKGVKATLRLAGNATKQSYLEQVNRFIADHCLEKSVKLLGRIDYQTVADELARASVFVLASLEENSPMGIEEAMAAGVPVVTSNRCGMPYMVRDGESGYLIDPNDPEDIASRLQEILEDDDLRMSMGQKAIQIARDRFHPEVVARRTRQVYKRAFSDFQSKGANL